jgi:tetratricopeptide (TPR) repeat protein
MQTAANINRILIDVFSLKRQGVLHEISSQREFYQQFSAELIKGIHTKGVLCEIGNRLISLADHAYALRQMTAVEQVSQLLLNLPLSRQYERIGQYYQALSVKRYGKFEEARTLLERVAEDAPLRYRARAILTIGATFYERADFNSALPYYAEANRAAACNNWCDPLTIVQTQRMIAVLKSIDGDPHSALADLKRLLPLARMVGSVYPFDYYNHWNSLAVELMETGQLEEAEQACQIALASTFANSYPEYRETRDEISLKGYRASRSVIVVNQRLPKLDNVVSMPIREQSESISSEKPIRPFFHQQAGVTFMQEWKTNMVKKRDGDKKDDKPKEELDDREMLLKIVQISTQKGLPDVALQEMVDALENIAAKYTQKDDKTDK